MTGSSVVTDPTPAAEKVTRNRPGIKQNPLSVWGSLLFMGVFALYFLIPVWWLFVASSKDRAGLNDSNPLWFADFQLFANIGDLFTYQDGIFFRWIVNSILYAGIGAIVGTLLAAMAGYALAKYAFPGREVVFNVILGGVLVPATALALPLFLLFSRVNQVDTFWAVFLPSIVSPFGVYLSRIYAAASVPEEILEAARLDGSGEVRTFFTVSVRLMAPAMVTIFLFQFVYIWNNFFLPLIMLQDDKLYPLTLGLYTWQSQLAREPELRGLVLVGSLISILPLIIAFLGLQRFWQSGLAAGGVK